MVWFINTLFPDLLTAAVFGLAMGAVAGEVHWQVNRWRRNRNARKAVEEMGK